MRVGILRGRHNIRAPAASGHPLFERAYRVQLNTLEQLAVRGAEGLVRATRLKGRTAFRGRARRGW
jgi:hypothetical protein